MKTYYCVLLMLLLAASSCIQNKPKKDKPAVTRDTLVYQYQTIKLRADNCGNKPDSSCTTVLIKYPVFKNDRALNDSVTRQVTHIFRLEGKTIDSVRQLASSFIKTYQNVFIGGHNGNYLDIVTKVVRQDSSITTLQTDEHAYTGGAHGNSLTRFINWNNHTHQTLLLDSLLKAGYGAELTSIAEKIFWKEENLTDTSSLSRDYFFNNGKFSLNNNYLITPVGIRFLYNEYEIKPYAAGQTDIVVPYAQLKSMIRPHTVLAQYTK